MTLPARNSRSDRQHQQQQQQQQPPLTPASHLTHQFLNIYNKGKILFPSIAVTSVLLYSYVAYALRDVRNGRLSRLYLAAASLTIGVVPYTIGLMMPTNKLLEAHATRDDNGNASVDQKDQKEKDEVRQAQDREVPALLEKWTRLNAVRGVFPLLGAALGAAVSFGLV